MAIDFLDSELDYGKHFFILQEDRGSVLRISIPGIVPETSDKRIIHWSQEALDMHPQFISRELKKQKEKEIISLLDEQKKSFSDLPQKNVPGYTHNYPYSFQYATTSDICRDPNDIVYTRNDVQHYARHMLWFPLEKIIADKKSKYTDIQIELPVFPAIITEDFYKEWYESNQHEMLFLTRTLEQSSKTSIEKIEREDCILLKLKNHSFINQPVKRIQLIPTEQQEHITLTEKEEDLLKTSVLKRDARLLNNLTNRERRHFLRGQRTDEADNLHLHWIHWDFLNGSLTKDNAILVTHDIQTKYRLTIEQPFIQYWETLRDFFINTKKPVFLDIPIPMNCYRHKPITKEHMHPQERRFINRQERHKLNLMTYQAGRTYGDE